MAILKLILNTKMNSLKKLQEIYSTFSAHGTHRDELDYTPTRAEVAAFLQNVNVDARTMSQYENIMRKLFSPRNNTFLVETYLRVSQDLKEVFLTFKSERELLCRLMTECLDKIRDFQIQKFDLDKLQKESAILKDEVRMLKARLKCTNKEKKDLKKVHSKLVFDSFLSELSERHSPSRKNCRRSFSLIRGLGKASINFGHKMNRISS